MAKEAKATLLAACAVLGISALGAGMVHRSCAGSDPNAPAAEARDVTSEAQGWILDAGYRVEGFSTSYSLFGGALFPSGIQP